MKLSTLAITLIALLTSVNGICAQDNSSQPLAESHIGQTPLSKNDQWHNLRRWVSLTFDHSNVIDMEDAERGTMIIKWSCPVAMSSEYVGAAVAMTYVIDVRDGKYRLQRLNPRVIYQFSRPDTADYFDGTVSPAAAADIKLITDLSRQYFDGSLEWPVNDRYEDIAAAYLAQTSAVPQYRSDRDREKGRISDEWKRAERNWSIIGKPYTTLRQLDASMLASLAKALSTNDDF